MKLLQGSTEGAQGALSNLAPGFLGEVLFCPIKSTIHLGAPSLNVLETETTGSFNMDASTLNSGGEGEAGFGSVLEKLLCVRCQYISGLVIEAQGKPYQALSEYVVITTCYRDSPFDPLWRSPAFDPFVGLSMYRYGVLCYQLATVKIKDLPDQGCPIRIDSMRKKLIYDAGVSLRMFLIFVSDNSCGSTRKIVALKKYVEVLEICFQRNAYKSAFSSDQYQIGDQKFCPENVQEDLLLCSMILESLHDPLPSDGREAQLGALSPRQKQAAKRMARIGATDILVQFYESLFQRFAATSTLYGNLLMANHANAQPDHVYVIGEIYNRIGGKDPFILTLWCQTCLLLEEDKVKKARDVLQGLYASEDEVCKDMKGKIVELMAKADLVLAYHCLPEDPAKATSIRESVIQLLEGILMNEPTLSLHLVLGIAYFDAGRLEDSERSLKNALDHDQDAWLQLAILKTAQKDYEAALEICNIQLDQQAHPDVNLCLLKTALLAFHFDQPEEAIELTKAAFAYWVTPAQSNDDNLFIGAGQQQQQQSTDPSTMAASSSDLTLNGFKERFVKGIPPQSVTSDLRFDQIPGHFPQTPLHGKCTILQKGFLLHALSPTELLRLHHHRQISQVQEGGKRPGLLKTLWLWLSKFYMAQNSLNEAELAARSASEMDELDPQVWYRLGRTLEAQGRTQDAIESYERGIDLDLNHPGCNLGLARKFLLLARSSHPTQSTTFLLGLALSHAKACLRSQPSNHKALSLMAECCKDSGLEDEASKYFLAALDAKETAPLMYISYV